MESNEEIKKMIKTVSSITGMTQEEIGVDMGYGGNYISEMFTPSGKVTKKFMQNFKLKYADYLENPNRSDVEYTLIRIKTSDLDKIRFSLNVLGSIFSPVSDLGKLEYPMVEDISDNKTSRSLKSQKGKQKDIS